MNKTISCQNQTFFNQNVFYLTTQSIKYEKPEHYYTTDFFIKVALSNTWELHKIPPIPVYKVGDTYYKYRSDGAHRLNSALKASKKKPELTVPVIDITNRLIINDKNPLKIIVKCGVPEPSFTNQPYTPYVPPFNDDDFVGF